MTDWDGAEYQRRIERITAQDEAPHGEADLVHSLSPATVLDAGCGTGRVAIELARRGVDVVGVDRSASMVTAARRLAPELTWVEQDLAELDLDRRFDVVVMAGNVPLFLPPGTTTTAVVAGCARHLAPGGHLVVGFGLGRGHDADAHDADARAAGLAPVARYATWERAPFHDDADFVVAVHRRPA